MVNHNNCSENLMADKIKLSKSEEMYLVTIRMICEKCSAEAIPIPKIAENLNVQPVSVNQMIKKLAKAGLVVYTPYIGVELTADGQCTSTKILRRRRLWEVFLVKDLNMELEKADELACQLEHLTSNDVAERLSDFLDNPKVCFHGAPIYSTKNQVNYNPGILLSDIPVGQPYKIIQLRGDKTVISFLSESGVLAGNVGKIIAADGSGNLLMETEFGKKLTVTKEIADHITVEAKDV